MGSSKGAEVVVVVPLQFRSGRTTVVLETVLEIDGGRRQKRKYMHLCVGAVVGGISRVKLWGEVW